MVKTTALSLQDIYRQIVCVASYSDEPVKCVAEKEWVVDGSIDIASLNKQIPSSFPEDAETLSGLLLSEYGNIPPDGTTISIALCGFLFETTCIENHTISSVRITVA